MTEKITSEQLWHQIKDKVYNNVKVYLLRNFVNDILLAFRKPLEQLVAKYTRQLPTFVAQSEQDDLMAVARIELLETIKVWSPDKGAEIWPLAYLRITGAMKDHIRYITRTDPSRFYDWVADAAFMLMAVNKTPDFEHTIETGVELSSAMKVLTIRERKIVIAHVKNDLTFKQIGDEIGISESQISRIYSKSIKAIKAELTKSQ